MGVWARPNAGAWSNGGVAGVESDRTSTCHRIVRTREQPADDVVARDDGAGDDLVARVVVADDEADQIADQTVCAGLGEVVLAEPLLMPHARVGLNLREHKHPARTSQFT